MSFVTSAVSGTTRHSTFTVEAWAEVFEVSKVQLLSLFILSCADSTSKKPF